MEFDSIERQSETTINGLDTLRAIAILLVIPRHAWELLGEDFVGQVFKAVFYHGWIGVDIFFVLSGFLISSQLFQSISRKRGVEFRRFFVKRFFRIIPCYFAVLGLYVAWPDFREKPVLDPVWRFMLFIMNYDRVGDAFSHAWSLCVEEHFYLLFPFIASAALRWPQFIQPAKVILMLFGLTLLSRAYFWYIEAPFYVKVYRPTHTHLDGLLCGVTVGLLSTYRPKVMNVLHASPWKMFMAGILLLACGLGVFGNIQNFSGYVLTFTLISLGFSSLVICAITPGYWLSEKKIPGAKLVSTLAYTLYLTHKQMIHLAKLVTKEFELSDSSLVLMAVLFTVIGSLALHTLIEKPFLRLRAKVLMRC